MVIMVYRWCGCQLRLCSRRATCSLCAALITLMLFFIMMINVAHSFTASSVGYAIILYHERSWVIQSQISVVEIRSVVIFVVYIFLLPWVSKWSRSRWRNSLVRILIKRWFMSFMSIIVMLMDCRTINCLNCLNCGMPTVLLVFVAERSTLFSFVAVRNTMTGLVKLVMLILRACAKLK